MNNYSQCPLQQNKMQHTTDRYKIVKNSESCFLSVIGNYQETKRIIINVVARYHDIFCILGFFSLSVEV